MNISSMPEPFDFSFSASTNSKSIDIGSQDAIDYTISHLSGRGAVTISASGIPEGVAIAFDPISGKLSKNDTSFTSKMSIHISNNAVNGVYNLEIIVDGGEVVKNQTLELTITGTPLPPPEYPVIAAAGDIACKPQKGKGALKASDTKCHHKQTSDILVNLNPTAVLTLGDNQYDGGEYDNFLKSYDPTWGRLKDITYPTVGNHEYGTPDASGHFRYFGTSAGPNLKGYYYFQFENWTLIALNSNCERIGGCDEGSPQALWLENLLEQSTSNCVLAFMHHPRFGPGTPDTSLGDHPELDYFWRLLYQYKADLVLAGHNHVYERLGKQTPDQVASADGIRQFIIGSGGKDLSGFSVTTPNVEMRNSNTFGVLKVELHENSYNWQFIPEEGRTFTDTGSELCN